MAARGIGFCNGHLSPTRLNSSQKPSHSALPHSCPCTPVCRYTRFAFPSSEPGGNLPAAPHHSRPLPAVPQSPSNRSLLHQPSQCTASTIAARCVSPGRTQPSARNSISSPRFPPSDLAGKPLPVLCHLQSKNEKPRCSNRNTTAFYSLNRAGHYAPDRFLIQNTYFLNELQRSGATLYSYRRIT